MLDAQWWDGLFDSIDAKDTSRFVAYLTEDAEFRYGSGQPVAGRAAIGDAVDNFFSSIDSSEHTPGRRIESGDTAICEGWVRQNRPGMPMFCRARDAFLRLEAASHEGEAPRLRA